jgi:hypothetical protein
MKEPYTLQEWNEYCQENNVSIRLENGLYKGFTFDTYNWKALIMEEGVLIEF